MKSLPTLFFLLLFLTLFSCSTESDNSHNQKLMVSTGYSTKQPLPDELLPFIPEGYAPMLLESGDFNKDGRSDYILALETLLPADLGEENTRELNRRLKSPSLIILRQNDNTLKLHTKNERAILQGYALGINGEELKVVVDSLGGGFTISYITRDIESQGQYSIDDYHFIYDRATDSFYLDHIKEEFGLMKPELHPVFKANSDKVYKPKVGEFDVELGKIPYSSFDIIKYIEAGGPHQKKL